MAEERERGIECFDRIPHGRGGYLLAETLWMSCLPLIEKLTAIRVAAYTPMVRERRRGEKRGVIETATPAFGGYFWIANQDEVEIPESLAVRFRPFYLRGFYWFSEGQIETMREDEASWPVLKADPARERLPRGAEIEVVAGLFQGRTGTVKADSGERVKVSLGGFVVDMHPFLVRPV